MLCYVMVLKKNGKNTTLPFLVLRNSRSCFKICPIHRPYSTVSKYFRIFVFLKYMYFFANSIVHTQTHILEAANYHLSVWVIVHVSAQ